MKLTDSLDRACALRMRAAARPRLILLALIGFAVVAPLLSGTAIASAVGDGPKTAVASVGLLGGIAFAGPLREEDPGAPQGGGSDPTAGGEDPKLTIGQRLSAALASKASLQAAISDRDAKIAEHAATIERLNGELSAAKNDLDQANAKITQLEADAAEVDRALKSAEAEAKELKGKATTVEKKAQEQVASLGFSAGKLPAAQEGEGEETTSDTIFEKFKAETNPEKRTSLYREHQKALARERAADAA